MLKKPPEKFNTSKIVHILLVMLLPLTVLPFATVHDGWIVLCVGFLLLIPLLSYNHPPSPPSTITFFFAVASFAALCLSALPFLPGSGLLRTALQPGLVDHLSAVQQMAEVERRPLALNLSGGCLRLAWNGALLGLILFLAGTKQAVRRHLAMSVVASGLLTMVVALIHRELGATQIYGNSGVPIYTHTPFFAPFVNPNHAGTLLAAGSGLALGLGGPMWLFSSAILAAGVWLTGSRGAVLALLLCWAFFALRTWGRRAWFALGMLSTPAVLATVWIGPRQVARLVTLIIVPESHMQDLTGNRLQIWTESLALLEKAPVLGTGLGGFSDGFRHIKRLPQYRTVDHAHNDLLQTVIEQGVAGALLWSLAAVMVLWAMAHCRRPLDRGWAAAAVAIATSAMVDFPLQIGAISVLMAMVVGALLSATPPATRHIHRWQRGIWSLALLALIARMLLSSESAQLAQGDDAHQAGQVDVAAQHYRHALWLTPMSHQALLRLGRAAWEDGRMDDARQLYTLTAEGYPTLLWPWVNLARIAQMNGETAQSDAAWREVLRNNVPDNDDETRWVREALTSSPDPVATALAIAPPRSDRQRAIALELADMLDTPGARETTTQLLRQAMVDAPAAQLDLVSVLLRWGEPQMALEELERVEQWSCRAIRLQIKTLEALERFEDARHHLDRGFRVCGEDDPKLEAAQQRILLLVGAPHAIDDAQQELRDHPGRSALRRRLIAALCRQQPLQRDTILVHLEHLLLYEDTTLQEAQRYSQISRGGDCAIP